MDDTFYSTDYIEIGQWDQFAVKFKKLTPEAIIPKRATEFAAGMDLYSAESLVLGPGEFKAVSTGLAIEIPNDYEGQVRARSGNALKYGIGVVNSPGTIDCDYRGPLKVILVNHGKNDFVINQGDRIAQLVIARVSYMPPIEVEELSEAPTRGDKGFGSTGR